MPVVFKSRHAPNIVMLESVARSLIRMTGHSGDIPGSIPAERTAQALAELERQIASAGATANTPDDDDDRREHRVSLRHRALPLMDMLKRAASEGDYVIWDHGNR